MNVPRHITWENFEENFIKPSVPALHPIHGTPTTSLFYRPNPPQIGVRIALTSVRPTITSPFRELTIECESTPSGPLLSIATGNQGIFRQVFPVLLEVADAVQLDQVDPVAAAEWAVRRISKAVKLVDSLAIEKVLGLWGELWVLQRLVDAHGPEGFACWHGWKADRHDFRIGKIELEVKTTLAVPTVHIIHGLGQLTPTKDHELYIVSMALSRSDRGITLQEQVRRLCVALAPADGSSDAFLDALETIGANPTALTFAKETFVLRRQPELVVLDDAVPALTADTLKKVFPSDALGRIADVQYRLNVEGLGLGSDTATYQSAIPWIKP